MIGLVLSVFATGAFAQSQALLNNIQNSQAQAQPQAQQGQQQTVNPFGASSTTINPSPSPTVGSPNVNIPIYTPGTSTVPVSSIPSNAIIYQAGPNGTYSPSGSASQIQNLPPPQAPQQQVIYKEAPLPEPQYIKKAIDIPEDELQKKAVEGLMKDYFGITPEEILKFREEADRRARASATLPVIPPKPVIRTVNVALNPGSHPQVIRTFINNATSLVITDNTGTPWPVLNYSIGNETAFDVKRMDVQNTEAAGTTGGSMFSITPKANYAQTNFILALKDLPTPVVLTLVTGQKEVDYRADIRILARGPNSVVYEETLSQGPNSELLSILDGVIDDAESLKVLGPETDMTYAWKKNDKMILKTNLKILSPIPTSFVQSPDGTTVYEFKLASALVAMKDGKFINMNISGW